MDLWKSLGDFMSYALQYHRLRWRPPHRPGEGPSLFNPSLARKIMVLTEEVRTAYRNFLNALLIGHDVSYLQESAIVWTSAQRLFTTNPHMNDFDMLVCYFGLLAEVSLMVFRSGHLHLMHHMRLDFFQGFKIYLERRLSDQGGLAYFRVYCLEISEDDREESFFSTASSIIMDLNVRIANMLNRPP